jgi:hypothetical protein
VLNYWTLFYVCTLSGVAIMLDLCVTEAAKLYVVLKNRKNK